MAETRKVNVEAPGERHTGVRSAGTNLASSQAPIPAVLHTVRQSAKQSLNELVQAMFTQADEVLFEMADGSPPDEEQMSPFESMRQIRLQREDICEHFTAQFFQGFEQAVAPDLVQEETPTDSDEHIDLDAVLDGISLVQNEELEVSVAMSGIVNKVSTQFALPLMQITQRIDSLCDAQITERSNPLGPYQISNAFVTAMEQVDVDIKIRLIILKLFERCVMQQLGPMYDEANGLFVDAGVLPELQGRGRLKRAATAAREPGSSKADPDESSTASSGDQAAAAQTPAGGAQTQAGSAQTEFGELQNLLADVRAMGPATVVAQGPVLVTKDLVTALDGLQSESVTELAPDEVPAGIDLRQLVLARTSREGEAGNIGQADDDVFNLVGMLFEYILNDRNLAIPMKALIARLQIPILKVAVLDKSFFSNEQHPARQLLNDLSGAGIGWSSSAELKRDATYDLIESIVLRVLHEFENDIAIFDALAEELRQFVAKDSHKTTLVEQRVKDAESGKEKTRAARSIVQKLINEKAAGLRLPPDVGKFVSDTWSKVLVYACIKHGPETEAWQGMVSTLEDLLWCLQPMDDAEALRRRDEITPSLMERIEQGMASLELPVADVEACVMSISETLGELANNDRAYIEDTDAPAQEARFEALEELDEIVLTEAEPKETVKTAAEEKYLVQVGQLTEGSWIELVGETGATRRCKLATIVQPGDRYVFVNRRGMKIAERSKMGLAVELKCGTLTLLDESQVFDRALQAVIGNLRKMNRDEPMPAE